MDRLRHFGAVMAVPAMLLSACADHVGLVMAETVRAGNGVLVEITALGPAFHADGDGAGIDFGWSRHRLLYPAGTDLDLGRSFLAVSLPSTPPALHDQQVVGLALRLGGPESGVALGLQRQVATTVPPGAAQARQLAYDPANPRRSCVSVIAEESAACADQPLP